MTDSNATGLRVAFEDSIGVLPGTPDWYEMAVNSYGDFGAEFKTEARSPISRSRQRRKGNLMDMDAGADFEVDFTDDLYRHLPCFMFAAWREKKNVAGGNISGGNTIACTGNTGSGAIQAGDLVWVSGYANAANNGLKLPSAANGTTITIAGLTNETAPAGCRVTKVGVQGGTADLTLTVTGGVATLGSTTLDLTTLGLIPGEWIYIGGDAAAAKFATAANNGWYRVKTIAAGAVVFDRVPGVVVTDAGTGKTIQIFIGHAIKNESDPDLIVRKTAQLERAFPSPLKNEYIPGAVADQLEFSIKTSGKLTVNMGYVGLRMDEELAKTGNRPSGGSQSMYTASNDFGRIRMLDEDANVTLASYVEEMKITVMNNAYAKKAIGTLGAWDIGVGDFVVSGSTKGFYTTDGAVNAIKNNNDASHDFGIAKENSGWYFDLPRVTLGDGRKKVEKDAPIKIDLTEEAVAHETLDHTMLINRYTYLPNAAM